MMIFYSNGIKEYDEMVIAFFGRGSYAYAPNKLNLYLKNKVTPLARPSIREPQVLELKFIHSHLCYAFLGVNNTLTIIIAIDFLDS